MAKPRIIAPPELENYLVIENCDDFPIDRYYATQVQRELINSILETEKLTPEMHKLGLPYLNATLLSGPPGNGKAQPLYSKVLTPDGFRNMGDIKSGDKVIAVDGTVAYVLGVFPQGKRPVYEFILKNGMKVRSADNHLWKVKCTFGEEGEIIRTTDYIHYLMSHAYRYALPIFSPENNKIVEYVEIKKCIFVGEEECQCIYIDHPEHLYITDNFIVTHNTTFARFVAFTMGVDLVYINFATLVSGILGSTNQHIHDIFSFLKDKECVFLLDEIDTIGVKRGTESGATGGELSRITVTVMQELDYYKTHDYKAIILAATNRKDILDPALVSRFAVAKELPSLTNDERISYMYMFLDDVGVPYDKENIKHYVLDNATVRQRNLEMDMIRCIAEWIRNGRNGNVIINHVE